MSGRFREAKRIFQEAVERPRGERERYVRDACGGEEDLAREVLALLAADATDDPIDPGVPPDVPGYRIVRRIGTGGMGIVYEAEQESPRRRVALKMLITAFAGEEAFRRFQYETEILARLDHPGIARIHAAGRAGGQPWFAMELVDGVPLLDHAFPLDQRGRVDLVARIADAVQHAHERGVLHRDLKPGNVLVDRAGNPRLLDFGVATLFGDATALRTLETRTGQLLGTLPYMSPEQLAAPGDVDVRSDVYALGVMAFELIAGRRPIDIERLSLHEAILRLRNDEIPRLGSLSGRWRGDLDTIVAKATARDSRRRYASAGAFADDFRRFLGDEPVLARPPSVTYQLRKFARRNRALVLAATGILASLVVGLALSVREYRRAVHAEAKARIEATTSDRVTSLLLRIFEEADPTASRGETLTVREALDKGSQLATAGLDGEPAVKGRLQHAIGQVYHGLGLHDTAAVHLEQALARRRALHGGDHEEVADSLMLLAEARHFHGQRDVAEPLYRECLAMRQRLHGPDHPKVARTMDVLGRLRRELGDFGGAERLHAEAMRIRRATGGEKSEAFVESLHSFAFLHHVRGEMDPARECYERAIALRKELNGEGDPHLPELLHGLGRLYCQRGDLPKSEATLKDCVARTRTIYGPRHSFLALALSALAETLSVAGRAAEAGPLIREALAIVGEAHPDYPNLLMTLGNVLCDAGDYPGAVARYAEAEARFRSAGDSSSLVVALQSQGTTLAAVPGRADDAERKIREAVALQSSLAGAADPRTVEQRLSCVKVLLRVGRLDAARTELDLLEADLPPEGRDREQAQSLARALESATGGR